MASVVEFGTELVEGHAGLEQYFVMLCPRDLADDIAYLAVWCMVKTRRTLEAQYMHIPPDRAPVTYPLVPADMARTPIPLHPAAARAYADLGDEVLAGALIWN